VSSIPAYKLNAELMARPQAERDELLLGYVTKNHIDAVLKSLDVVAREEGGGGLKSVERIGPLVTKALADDTLLINVGTSIKTNNGFELRPWVPIALLSGSAMRAGFEAALGFGSMKVSDEMMEPESALPQLTDTMRSLIKAGVVAAGRHDIGLTISGVTIGTASKYFDFTSDDRQPSPMYFLGHPGEATGPQVLASPLPDPTPDTIFATVHTLTGFGTEQRLHIFKLQPDGSLKQERELIIGLGGKPIDFRARPNY
jgi:hypothetical protein